MAGSHGIVPMPLAPAVTHHGAVPLHPGFGHQQQYQQHHLRQPKMEPYQLQQHSSGDTPASGSSAATDGDDDDSEAGRRLTARMRRALVQDSRVAEGSRSGTVSSKDGVSWGRVNNPISHVEDSGLPPSWPPVPYPRDYLHTNLPPDDGRVGRLTRAAVVLLRKWMVTGHTWLSPYPSGPQIQHLEQETGMSQKQLRDWFRNERKRVWLPFWQSRLSAPGCPWVVNRSAGGRANILPKTVHDRFGSMMTELDVATAIALDTGAVKDESTGSRGARTTRRAARRAASRDVASPDMP